MNYYKNISLWAIKIGLFIVPFIPLYVSRALFFPYITGKAFAFRIIVETVFALWLFLAIFYKEYRPRLSWISWAVLFFVVSAALTTIFGENSVKSLWSNFERMEGLVAYIHLAAYFFVLSHVFTKKEWFIFFNAFVIAGVFENIYALLQKFGVLASPQGGARVDGTIGNPTYLAAYLIFVSAFCLLLILESKEKIVRYCYAAAFLFTMLIIYFTASRGPVIAILIGTILAGVSYVFLADSAIPRNLRYKKIAAVGLVALVVTVGALWSLRNTTFIKGSDPQYTPPLARLTSLSFSERTVSSRFTIWKMGFEGFAEHPVLGWGPDNYGLVFAKYYKAELWAQEPWFDRSHNVIIDWLINGGIIGFIGFFGMLGTVLAVIYRLMCKQRLSLAIGLLLSCTLIIYLIQNLFVFDNIATYMGLFAIFAYVHGLERNNAERATHVRISAAQPLVFVALVVFVGGMAYVLNIRPLISNLNLLSALKNQGTGNFEAAYNDYDRAMSYGILGRTEMREQYLQYAMAVGGSGADVNFKDKVLRRAETEAIANVDANPMDPRAKLFLGALYARLSATDIATQKELTKKALDTFNEALKLSPAKQQIYFEVADIYLRNGDLTNAVRVSKEAYDLDPHFPAAQINLVASYILSGQQNEADKVLLEWYGTVDVQDKNQVLVQAYARMVDMHRQQKNAERAAYYANRLTNLWRAYIKNVPDRFEYRKRLAIVYLVLGQQLEAQQVLQDALIQYPAFKQEIEAFIRQVQSGNIQ